MCLTELKEIKGFLHFSFSIDSLYFYLLFTDLSMRWERMKQNSIQDLKMPIDRQYSVIDEALVYPGLHIQTHNTACHHQPITGLPSHWSTNESKQRRQWRDAPNMGMLPTGSNGEHTSRNEKAEHRQAFYLPFLNLAISKTNWEFKAAYSHLKFTFTFQVLINISLFCKWNCMLWYQSLQTQSHQLTMQMEIKIVNLNVQNKEISFLKTLKLHYLLWLLRAVIFSRCAGNIYPITPLRPLNSLVIFPGNIFMKCHCLTVEWCHSFCSVWMYNEPELG